MQTKAGLTAWHLINPAILLLALSSCAGTGTDTGSNRILFLPDDREAIDQLMVAGTREFRNLDGLSRIEVPGTEATYYSIDRQNAQQGMILEALSGLPGQAFLGITQNQGGGVLWRNITVSGSPDPDDALSISFRHFRPSIVRQLSELQNEKAPSDKSGTVYYTEYQFSTSECPGLAQSIEAMQSTISEATDRIGLKPPLKAGEVEEVVIDGPYYLVQLRMQKLTGNFEVGGNSGQLFDDTSETVQTIQRCISEFQGKQKAISFGNTQATEIIFRKED